MQLSLVRNNKVNQSACHIWPKKFRILWFMLSFGVCCKVKQNCIIEKFIDIYSLDFNNSNRDFKTGMNKISKSVLTVSC